MFKGCNSGFKAIFNSGKSAGTALPTSAFSAGPALSPKASSCRGAGSWAQHPRPPRATWADNAEVKRSQQPPSKQVSGETSRCHNPVAFSADPLTQTGNSLVMNREGVFKRCTPGTPAPCSLTVCHKSAGNCTLPAPCLSAALKLSIHGAGRARGRKKEKKEKRTPKLLLSQPALVPRANSVSAPGTQPRGARDLLPGSALPRSGRCPARRQRGRPRPGLPVPEHRGGAGGPEPNMEAPLRRQQQQHPPAAGHGSVPPAPLRPPQHGSTEPG